MIATLTTSSPLRPGIAGNRQTLDVMRKQVVEAVGDPQRRTRECCIAILQRGRAPGGDRLSEARALFAWIARNVPFRRDPGDIQGAQSPLYLLAKVDAREPVAAACNQQGALMAALGWTVRLPIVWVLIGEDPNEYEHLYAAMDLTRDGWQDFDRDLLALDTAALPKPQFGVHTPGAQRWVVEAFEGL